MKNYNNGILASLITRPTITVDTSSVLPAQITYLLDQYRKQYPNRDIILANNDVWRYTNDPTIKQYFQNDSRNFYIAYLGYINYQQSHNVWYISWPIHFFTRPDGSAKTFKMLTRCTHGFSCLNNKASFHRLILGHELYCADLIGHMIFSQNTVDLPCGYYQSLLDTLPRMKEYRSLLPIRWINERATEFAGPVWNFQRYDHDAFNLAYCNIATESDMQEFIYNGPIEELPVITEKSFKAFRAGQIPIWFAAKGQMHYLRSLEFEIMQDLVPSDFDNMGVYDKAKSIADIVAKGKDWIEHFYHTHLKEIQHNFELVHSEKVDQRIINDTKIFLETCQ